MAHLSVRVESEMSRSLQEYSPIGSRKGSYMKTIELDFRYYHRPRRVGIGESDIHHNTLHRSFDAGELALILVDVWNDHHIATHLQRGRDITLRHIKPIIEAFRQVGATVIHAPSPDCARQYPQWVRYAGDDEVRDRSPSPKDDWPPPDFRNKTGDYERLARPSEPSDQAIDDIVKNRRIIAEVSPQNGDEVIVNGGQLHRLLRHKKILYLFFAGFAANICVPFRDYGMRAMKDRGYEIVLIRDCTTAIETADTIEDLDLSRNAVRDAELNIGYTVSSSELIAACQKAALL